MVKSTALVLISLLALVSLIACLPFVFSQTETNVNGVISSDTIWTKANSPYILSGNVLVPNMVTLTIEPGVIINLRGFYVTVNGTLIAKGSDANPIVFSGGIYGVGSIVFTKYSLSWDSQTNSGSVLEHVTAAVNVTSSSPRIAYCHLGLTNINGGHSIISNNIAFEVDVFDGSPQITDNNFNVPLENNLLGQINVYGGTPLIMNNFVNGTTAYRNNGDSRHPNLEQIFMPDFGILVYGATADAQILDNTISYHGTAGVNIITGNASIVKNLITNNQEGISDQTFLPGQTVQNTNLMVENNTITYNSFCGVANTYSSAKISLIFNNIYGNSQYSVYLGSSLSGNLNSNDVNAALNWWGTSDPQTVNQTIYDFKNDFNLGRVNFSPFLTTPNGQAMPDQNTPIPTTTPITSLKPTPTPTVPEFPTWIILSFFASVFLVAVYLKHKRINYE